MSRALRESGSPLDIPRFLFKVSLWSWFLYRTGEELFYYILRKFNIPHTPKWKYDYNLKYSDNMTNKERWKKSKLFETAATPGLAASTKRQSLSTASGKGNGRHRAIQNKL